MNFAGILTAYQHYGVIAFIATVFLTPLAIRAAHRFGVLDVPDRLLKPHARPIPYLGGAAICAAWAVALLTAMLTGTCAWQTTLPILLGGVGMSILGLVDDIRPVPPKLRLVIGTAIIAGVIATTGAGVRFGDSVIAGVSAVAWDFGWEIPTHTLRMLSNIGTPASVVIGVFVVLGACNSANLIDGLDGLCTGVTAIISAGFFVLAAHLAVLNYSATGDPVRLVLAIAMFGAALGFLPWNFNPAKIFMGDAGSVLLGYNCGMLILLFAERGYLRWIIGALMIFALPVFDTALAMYRRWRSGRSIFEGDRSHFYDQLVQRGFSVRQTVLVCYGLTLLYVAIGLLLTWVRETGMGAAAVIRTRYAVVLYVGVCALTAVFAWWAGLTSPEEAKRRSNGPSDS